MFPQLQTDGLHGCRLHTRTFARRLHGVEKGFHYGLWLKSIMFLKNNLKTLPKKKRLQIGAQIRATVQKRISK